LPYNDKEFLILKSYKPTYLGTGKSYLIETLSMYIKQKYQNENNKTSWLAVVLAPTGLAAYNINGQTIHRFLKLPVAKDNNDKFWNLSDASLKVIREFASNTRLFMFGKKLFNN
jgi:hypothetical protein